MASPDLSGESISIKGEMMLRDSVRLPAGFAESASAR